MHSQSLLFIFSNKHSLIEKKSPSVLVIKTAFNWCLNKEVHLSMRILCMYTACLLHVYCMVIFVK